MSAAVWLIISFHLCGLQQEKINSFQSRNHETSVSLSQNKMISKVWLWTSQDLARQKEPIKDTVRILVTDKLRFKDAYGGVEQYDVFFSKLSAGIR